MHAQRMKLLKKLEAARGSKVVVYVTGDRPGLETQIHPETIDLLVHHLDLIGPTSKLTLFLHTRGGNALASWSIANLLLSFCDHLEVIVPAKAQSGGTLISLAADTIVMTKQATLGPIDPSINGPLNPQVPGSPQARVPVSVEAINGYVEFARTVVGASGPDAALQHLSTQVHPLVLGNAYRSRAQIRMLARRLVARQLKDDSKIAAVLDFLCSESGSHDYTIFRREAANILGLNVQKPSENEYALIKSIYDDIANELELATPFDMNVVLGTNQSAKYSFRRAIIETISGGVHVFLSEGTMQKTQVQHPNGIVQTAFQDDRTFEGWRHEP